MNEVEIYNRWGNMVWKGTNYDNNEVVWFGQNNNGVQLSDGTYFYVANIRDRIYKGWVELTK